MIIAPNKKKVQQEKHGEKNVSQSYEYTKKKTCTEALLVLCKENIFEYFFTISFSTKVKGENNYKWSHQSVF